jgi:pyruvate kinase
MAKCCIEAEATMQYRRQYLDLKTMSKQPVETAEAVASACVQAVLDLDLPLIIVLTEGGKLARVVSKYRPPCKILACSLTG